MGDRIECGTFCVAAALTGGVLKIKGLDPKIIKTELDLLKKTGARIKRKGRKPTKLAQADDELTLSKKVLLG